MRPSMTQNQGQKSSWVPTTTHQAESVRPMTATRAAGYTSRLKTSQGARTKLLTSQEAPLETKGVFLREEKGLDSDRMAVGLAAEETTSLPAQIKALETKMQQLVLTSSQYHHQQNHQMALETAKEAAQLDKQASKLRERLLSQSQASSPPLVNLDLAFSVQLNLALRYTDCGMYAEALQVYAQHLIKNKLFPQGEKLRVNMGNVYMAQKDYANALKMYRMALDQVPTTQKTWRFLSL